MAEQEQSVIDEVVEYLEPGASGASGITGLIENIPGAGAVSDIAGGGLDLAKAYRDYEKGEYGDMVSDGAGGLLDVGKGAADIYHDVAGGENKASGPLEVMAGTVDMVSGFADIATDEGYGGQSLDGIHDILSGGTGIVGSMLEDTPAGAVAKGIGAGIDIGDALAPTIFNEGATEGTHMRETPQDGNWRAGTGNASVDGLIHGAEDIAGGNFGQGATELATGLPMVAQMALNPWGAVASETVGGAVASLWN